MNTELIIDAHYDNWNGRYQNILYINNGKISLQHRIGCNLLSNPTGEAEAISNEIFQKANFYLTICWNLEKGLTQLFIGKTLID